MEPNNIKWYTDESKTTEERPSKIMKRINQVEYKDWNASEQCALHQPQQELVMTLLLLHPFIKKEAIAEAHGSLTQRKSAKVNNTCLLLVEKIQNDHLLKIELIDGCKTKFDFHKNSIKIRLSTSRQTTSK